MNNSFEDKIISIGPRALLENSSFRKNLFEKKKKIIDDFRVKEIDFTDIYDEAEIQKDLEYVKNMEESWANSNSQNEKYNKEIASLLEGVIADQAESNQWLGENCEIIPASNYDDIKNGVDVISVFRMDEERKEYLGLGIDVTFAANNKVLLDKLNNIKEGIKRGKLATLKYFQDPDTGEHKKLPIPKIIIGTRLSSAEKLITLWGGKDEHKNQKLAEDPMQSKIILESLFQLRYFYDYAQELAQESLNKIERESYENISAEYGRLYNLFYDLYESKVKMIEKHINEISDDIVYETILEYTGNKS